jgi:hypothetical protein
MRNMYVLLMGVISLFGQYVGYAQFTGFQELPAVRIDSLSYNYDDVGLEKVKKEVEEYYKKTCMFYSYDKDYSVFCIGNPFLKLKNILFKVTASDYSSKKAIDVKMHPHTITFLDNSVVNIGQDYVEEAKETNGIINLNAKKPISNDVLERIKNALSLTSSESCGYSSCEKLGVATSKMIKGFSFKVIASVPRCETYELSGSKVYINTFDKKVWILEMNSDEVEVNWTNNNDVTYEFFGVTKDGSLLEGEWVNSVFDRMITVDGSGEFVRLDDKRFRFKEPIEKLAVRIMKKQTDTFTFVIDRSINSLIDEHALD